ncbi:MAG: hypothetical protein K8L97_17420 [Anaerolineae bacterium]|nr:hypothetical protein [Anaerolineae bacterium]
MGILILVACWLLIAVGWHFFTTPQQEYRNQTRFKDHVYYLNVSFGYVLGHDCNLTAYIVYQCDSLGVMCQSFTTPYLDSYPLTGCSGQLTTNEETRFFVDTDILYVQIGAEKFRVS